MSGIDRHLTDEELLLAADGELPALSEHLFACPDCLARLSRNEDFAFRFKELHQAVLNPQLPSHEPSRSLLAARLSGIAKPAAHGSESRRQSLRLLLVAAVLLLALLGTKSVWEHRLPDDPRADAAARNPALPDRSLTPGKFAAVRLEDVCRANPYEQDRITSVSLKRKVLAEYGMPESADADHEIDYLVIPELGGTEDIQNLWPEPYGSTEWNARVKDALEERLRDMVCQHKIDLATAQRDIATDWISAYKKYFHTDKPLYLGHST